MSYLLIRTIINFTYLVYIGRNNCIEFEINHK